MARKLMKGDTKMVKDEEPVLEDRISELPDDVILRILALLPTVVAIRTSLLSKRWRRMWTLVHSVDIDMLRDHVYFKERGKPSIGRRRLIKFVDECLRYPFPSMTVSKLNLTADLHGRCGRVDDWLGLPILKNVKELELGVFRSLYRVPQFILHLGGLTRLTLIYVLLETNIPVSLPLLKELDLVQLIMDNQTVNIMLLGCTSLERLRIYSCSGLSNPEFSSSSLKYFEFCSSWDTNQVIGVKARNLESFVFEDGFGNRTVVNFIQCWGIRNISLKNVWLDDQWVETWIPQFALLESLNVTKCHGRWHIKIQNRHLKSFVFDSDERFDSLKATIDTPSLEYFCYIGVSFLQISVNAPNLVNADIRIRNHPMSSYDTEWYFSLIQFLSEFNGCKTAHLFFPSKTALMVPEETRKIYHPPFPDLKCLKVKTSGSILHKKNMFRDSLHWIAPSLETLAIEQEQYKPRRYSARFGDL